MTTDPLAGVRIKVERAKRHIRDLETARAAFLERRPYESTREEDVEARQFVFRVRVNEQPPAELGAIIGDVLSNLHSALDILWRVATRSTPRVRGQYFPRLFGSSAEYEATVDREEHRFKKLALEALRPIKPYKGGSEALNWISEASNMNKHELLIPVGFSVVIEEDLFSGFKIPGVAPIPFPMAYIVNRPTHATYPLNDGAVIHIAPYVTVQFRDRVTAEPRTIESHNNLRFAFDIAFSKPEVIEGKPVLPTLLQMAQLVDNIVEQVSRLGDSE